MSTRSIHNYLVCMLSIYTMLVGWSIWERVPAADVVNIHADKSVVLFSFIFLLADLYFIFIYMRGRMAKMGWRLYSLMARF